MSKVKSIIVIAGRKLSYLVKTIFSSISEYQNYLLQEMKGRVCIFYNDDKANCSSHKTTLKRAGWYLESPGWLINKKQLIIQRMKIESDSLHQQKIHNHPEKISDLKLLVINIILKKFSFLQNQKISKN